MPIAERDYDRQALPKVDLRRPLDYSQPSNKSAIVVAALDKGIQAGLRGYQTYARHKQANFNKEVSLHQAAMREEYGEILLNATDEQLADQSWLKSQGVSVSEKFLGGGRASRDFGNDLHLLANSQLKDLTSGRIRGQVRQNEKSLLAVIDGWVFSDKNKQIIDGKEVVVFGKKGEEKIVPVTRLENDIVADLKGPLVEQYKKLYPKTYKQRLMTMTLKETGNLAVEKGSKKAYALVTKAAQRLVSNGVLNESTVDRLRKDLAMRGKEIRMQRAEIDQAFAASERQTVDETVTAGIDALANGRGFLAQKYYRDAMNRAEGWRAKLKVRQAFSSAGLFKDMTFFNGILSKWASGQLKRGEAIELADKISQARALDMAAYERFRKVFLKKLGGGKTSAAAIKRINDANTTRRGLKRRVASEINVAYERSESKARDYYQQTLHKVVAPDTPLSGRAITAWSNEYAPVLGELEIVSKVLNVDYEDLLDAWFNRETTITENPLAPGDNLDAAYEALKSPKAYLDRTTYSAQQRQLSIYRGILRKWQNQFEKKYKRGRGPASIPVSWGDVQKKEEGDEWNEGGL